VVLIAAVAFSKRSTGSMAGNGAGAGDDSGGPVMTGRRDVALAAAIDRWIFDLGHEEHELRTRLVQVKAQLARGENAGPGTDEVGEPVAEVAASNGPPAAQATKATRTARKRASP
ncbi:MAG TPA: hypothetical protein VF954_01505, partial [Acidimicrobiales bacterium]